MYNLMQAKYGMHSPNTHIKGSHTVDFIFVTEDRIDPTKDIGMLPFREGIDSDHRGFFVSFWYQTRVYAWTTGVDTHQ
eukprot:144074-Ditylum_brightwellii.AAC.1